MIAAQAELAAVVMTEDGGDSDAIAVSSAQGIDVEQPAQIGCDLAGFLIYPGQILRIVFAVLAELELNPAVVAGTFLPGTAAPGPVIPILLYIASICLKTRSRDTQHKP